MRRWSCCCCWQKVGKSVLHNRMRVAVLLLLLLSFFCLLRIAQSLGSSGSAGNSSQGAVSDICTAFVDCQCYPEAKEEAEAEEEEQETSSPEQEVLVIDCSGQQISELPLSQLTFPYQYFRDHDTFAKTAVIFDSAGLRNLSFLQVTQKSPYVVDLFDLRNLPVTRLSLRHNHIFHIEGGQMNGFAKLEELDLSYNNLTSLHEGILGGLFAFNQGIEPKTLEELRVVKFNHNRIHKVHKGAFQYVPALRELHVAHNRIYTLHNHLFDNQDYLEVLDLSHNPIKVIGPQTVLAITSLESLQVLNLSHAGLSSLPEGLLRALGDLELLDLSGNSFRSVPAELRNTHESLYSLSLDMNPIATLNQSSFQGLAHLQELSLSYMSELSVLGPYTFGPLRSLRLLHMSHNHRLQRLHNEVFRGMAHRKYYWPVRQLHLYNNSMTTLTDSVVPWDRIRVVDIRRNPWSCDCRLRWMPAFINKQVTRRTPELADDITCSSPPRLKGLNVSQLDPTDMCPAGVPEPTTESPEEADCETMGDELVSCQPLEADGGPGNSLPGRWVFPVLLVLARSLAVV